MKKWISAVLISITSLHQAAMAADAKTITDSFVSNLSCQNLTVNSIYQAIQPTAFHTYFHIPITNWKFHSGGPTLGVCWGLSSAQRKMFYLARFDEKEELSKEDLVRKTLNMFRGAEFTAQQSGNGKARMIQTPATLEVLKYSDRSLMASWALEERNPQGLFPMLNRGYKETINGESTWMTFKLDLERSQQQHFFRGGNLKMITGDTTDRSPVENLLTVTQLEKNLKAKRLTMLVLRGGTTTQHVVVAKEILDMGKYFLIMVYDSNNPLADMPIYYQKSTQSFHAPAIMSVLEKTGDHGRSLGVFIVDEDEQVSIDAAMLKHYKAECAK
ncbi:hypothetical protein [Bdellovibrio sp. KM01]|uniref:hypothetical protein n=1 Tax=Bdellovibrio sp. KM01 TaxID=2748865 RepID=UPI0015E93870|nr:hypothetical protein [Bdellovibrio sp. KM01]QLY24170.1 hypothetical protein HW988_11920 [Bdellovibrio sp. KM01]